MAKSLNLERRLLEIGDALTRAGLDARVRALDFKGGQWLALKIRSRESVLELRYRKLLPSAKMLVAGTDANISSRVREVHQRLVRERGKVLENGYRRFLDRTVRLLREFESALVNDKGILQRAAEYIQSAKLRDPCRPAVVVRGVDRKDNRFDSHPAVAITANTSIDLAALIDGELVDLSDLLRNRREEQENVKPPGARDWSPLDMVTEVAGLGVDLVSSLADGIGALRLAGGSGAKATEAGASGVAEAASSSAAEVTAEAGQQAFDMWAESGSSAVEVVSEAGSCLGDAACGGLDCGGLDCISF